MAGLYGRPLDDLISRVLEVVFAFPGVLLALGIVGLLGPSVRNVIIAIGVVYTPVFGRLARATVLSAKERDYVEAARGCGASDLRLVGRHLLPNITAPLIARPASACPMRSSPRPASASSDSARSRRPPRGGP